jgi:hypothetical protein
MAGQEQPMYLRLLRRQPEQMVNLDKERGNLELSHALNQLINILLTRQATFCCPANS